ncbi:LolA family protein [Melioribacter sp. OK-6-Me]|uniref:LolA family protein n=1 Tax=unclassified Melioribacter TaxID=2627329 RepID=UPI003EDB0C5C
MLRSVLLLILVSLFVQSDPLLKKLQEKFDSIDSFTANFQFSSPTTNINGKIYYKKHNKFVIDSDTRKIISDARSLWNYDIKGKRVIISDIKSEPSSFSIEKYLFDLPQNCKVSSFKDKSGKSYLVLIPKIEEDFKKITIETSNDFFKKIELTDINGETHIIEFNNIKTDVNIKEEIFTFVPPKGIRIIDLR